MTTRIGLVGYGVGGRHFHAPIITSVPGVELVGVVTRSPERRAELAAEHPGVPAVDDVDALLELGVDLVTVSIAPANRTGLVEKILDAGVAVIVDKPFALSAAEARRLVEYAEACGGVLTVFHNRRLDSEQRTIAKALADGLVGEPLLFESVVDDWAPETATASTGGGHLLDLGSHLVDQARQLFGEVAALECTLHRVEGYSTEVGFDLRLDHVGGVRSQLRAHVLRAHKRPRMHLVGESAMVTVPTFDVQTEQVRAGESPRSLGEWWGVEPSERAAILADGSGARAIGREAGRWQDYYAELAAALVAGRPAPVDPRDALVTLELLELAHRSAEERRELDVPA